MRSAITTVLGAAVLAYGAAFLSLASDAGAPLSAAGATGGNAVPPEALEKARAAADALTSALMGKLLAELQAGGPPHAVRVCAEVAPSMAAQHSDATTLVRRVSLKYRNPADAPDAYEKEQLLEFARLHEEGRLPKKSVEVTGEGSERSLRYMRPIVVGQPCLACHGKSETIDPDVRRILSEKYPGDQATGYAAGDLRGAVSVKVRLEGPGAAGGAKPQGRP